MKFRALPLLALAVVVSDAHADLSQVQLVEFITGVTRPVAMRDAGNDRYYIVQQ